MVPITYLQSNSAPKPMVSDNVILSKNSKSCMQSKFVSN